MKKIFSLSMFFLKKREKRTNFARQNLTISY